MLIALFGNVIRSRLLRRPEIVQLNHIGCLFGNHNGRNVGVSRGDCRHDAAIDNPQLFDSINSKFRVDHSHGIRRRTHFGGARWVINRLGVMSSQASPEFIRETFVLFAIRRGVWVQGRVKSAENFGSRNFVGKL